MPNPKREAVLLALGRTFKYAGLSSRMKPITLRAKVVAPYDFEEAEVIFELNRGARFALTKHKLESGTHLFNEAYGVELPATTLVVFPLDRFSELMKKKATTWMTNWGDDGQLVKLSRVVVPPYKVKVEGTLQALPAVGAKGAGITITILDDAACPLLLAYEEKPYPLRLVEIGKPADRKMARLGPWPRPA